MKSKKVFIFIGMICVFTESYSQNIGGWVTTDSMLTKRENHAAVQLSNGNVLVTGGYTPTNGYGSNLSEIFNVEKKKWSAAAPMNKGRTHHNLVKLQDGSVIAIGGYSEVTCEILSKDYSSWTYTDSLKTRRYWGHSITLMQDGNVLLTGGRYVFRQTSKDTVWNECELYNYLKKEWIVVKDLNAGRYDHTATLLKDGRILVVGGTSSKSEMLNSCEIYDPKTNEWTFTEPMNYARTNHSATLLSNGKVLVVGAKEKISELYDPATNKWTITGSITNTWANTKAILLNNEECLLLIRNVFNIESGWDLYSLKNFTFLRGENYKQIIWDQAIVKLDKNRVLAIGGEELKYAGGIESNILPTSLCMIYDINLTGIKDVNNDSLLPAEFSLSQNYPNPFNPSTTISYKVQAASNVTLKVYDLLGRSVTTLVDGYKQTGTYSVEFRVMSEELPSGVYFYTLTTSQGMITKKMMLMK